MFAHASHGRALALVLVTLVPSGLPAQARSADAIIARAVEAIGGAEALRGLRNKNVEFLSASFGLGQEETPLSPARASVLSGRILTDYSGTRQLTNAEIRTPIGQVIRQRRVAMTTMSMLESNGVLQMDGPAIPSGLARNLSLQPERMLLSALEHRIATVLPPRTFRGEVMDGTRLLLGPDTVNLWFDRITGLPVVSETVTDDPVLGDRRTLTWYTRWQDAGGLKLPRQVDTEVNGRLLSHNLATSAAINQVIDESQFAIPDSMARRAPPIPAGPPAVTVTLVELAPGVWRAEGGSHHSLVVEQGQGLLVIEAPLNTARSNAVLDTLRSRFPRRPVTAVVATHHHHDHSGGLRGYMARGIRVIAHQRNVDFVRGIATARKTKAPDRLSRVGAVPTVSAVRDSLALGTGAGRVVLYPLPSIHGEGILAAWVPSAGIVFTSDVLTAQPNQPPAPIGSRELVAMARTVGIAPRRYAGGHGAVVEWSALEGAGR